MIKSTGVRGFWDKLYAQHQKTAINNHQAAWLDDWRTFIDNSSDIPILDLGCGTGIDSLYLTTNGFQVIAVDHSGEALKIAGATAPLAHLGQVDISGGLPFLQESFQVIIANLSLHYFQWDQTQNIVKDVHRCLRKGGVLLARFNSKKDVNYGAMSGEEIEPGYFFVNGILKRFFDQEDLTQLFQAGWEIHRLKEMEINRYRKVKVAWEVIVEKPE